MDHFPHYTRRCRLPQPRRRLGCIQDAPAGSQSIARRRRSATNRASRFEPTPIPFRWLHSGRRRECGEAETRRGASKCPPRIAPAALCASAPPGTRLETATPALVEQYWYQPGEHLLRRPRPELGSGPGETSGCTAGNDASWLQQHAAAERQAPRDAHPLSAPRALPEGGTAGSSTPSPARTAKARAPLAAADALHAAASRDGATAPVPGPPGRRAR